MYYPLKIDRIAEKEFLATCRVIPECKYMADNEAELIKTGVAALSKTLE